jgi:tubulin polyglutamylase TTLL9
MKLYLMSRYGQERVSEAFSMMQEIILKCLQSVQKVIINDKHCFELYGFDLLLDSNLKPWLIEVNASPSMTSNTPNDYEMKMGLLDDTFTTLDLERILSGTEE